MKISKRVVGVAVVLLIALPLARGVRAAMAEASSFRPRRGPVEVPPALAALPLRRDVTFTSASGTELRGWYVPGRNGAGVVLAHGSGADRSQTAAEARVLADAGFGVLAFDWPGHGESGGAVTFGKSERDALKAAVSFAASQSEIDPGRIGAIGFSIGAALLATAAAEDERVKAVILVSPFTDSDDQTRAEYAKKGPIAQWAAIRVDRVYMPDGPLRPIDAVAALGNRWLLVIAAADDPVVPFAMSEEVYAAAKARKELLVIPVGGHASIDDLAGSPYGQRILQFFEKTLNPVINPH